MAQTTDHPARQAGVVRAIVNTSIRLPVALRNQYIEAIKALDPDDDFASAIRRHMREVVAEHEQGAAA